MNGATVNPPWGFRPTAGYGWTPDLPDARDHLFTAAPQARTKVTFPPAVDLRPGLGPVFDQGELGSCTGNALAAAVLFELVKQGKATADDAHQVSRLFIYYGEREIEGTIKSDAGAMLRDGIKCLVKAGVPLETLWPYDPRKFAKKPNSLAYKRALPFVLRSYQRIVSGDDRLACLAAGFPFVCGFSVYESFETEETARTGVVKLPARGEQMIGGHAVLCVGYDVAADVYICRNSWGTGWGQAGNFTIPRPYLDNHNLSDDHWTLRA